MRHELILPRIIHFRCSGNFYFVQLQFNENITGNRLNQFDLSPLRSQVHALLEFLEILDRERSDYLLDIDQ